MRKFAVSVFRAHPIYKKMEFAVSVFRAHPIYKKRKFAVSMFRAHPIYKKMKFAVKFPCLGHTLFTKRLTLFTKR